MMEVNIGWSWQAEDLERSDADIVRGLESLAELGFGVVELPLDSITPDMASRLAEVSRRLGLRLVAAATRPEPPASHGETGRLLETLRCAALVTDAQAIPDAMARDRWVRIASAARVPLVIEASVGNRSDIDPRFACFHAATAGDPAATTGEPRQLAYMRWRQELSDSQLPHPLEIRRWAHEFVARDFDGPFVVDSVNGRATPSSRMALARLLLRHMDKLYWMRYQ
jgi:hypothetical protein